MILIQVYCQIKTSSLAKKAKKKKNAELNVIFRYELMSRLTGSYLYDLYMTNYSCIISC